MLFNIHRRVKRKWSCCHHVPRRRLRVAEAGVKSARSELGGVELLSTAQASHRDLAASDIASGPLPAPLFRLDLNGMAKWTLYGRALGG